MVSAKEKIWKNGGTQMNTEEIQKLKEKMKEFENQNIYIEIEQSIQYHTTINNASIIVSDENLIISDKKEQDFIIELHYLDEVEENGNTIYLEMSNNLSITLDY